MAAVDLPGGRTVHYDVVGDGPPLLLIAGLGNARSGWTPIVGALSSRFQVITFDNRDAGENDPETTGYTIADMADDAADLLSALGVERASVMGHSMGGFIALRLALDHPQMVERLVLVGTSAAAGAALGHPLPPMAAEEWIEDPVERARSRAQLSAAPGFFDEHPERLDEIAEGARGNRVSLEGYNRQLAAISDTHDARSSLARIDVPTLVIHGDLDPLIPPRGGEALARDIRNATLLIYSGVGHHPHRERTDQFIQDTLAFLESDRRP